MFVTTLHDHMPIGALAGIKACNIKVSPSTLVTHRPHLFVCFGNAVCLTRTGNTQRVPFKTFGFEPAN